MQEKSKILYKVVGSILDEARKNAGVKFNQFCYENDIYKGTFDRITKGKSQASLYTLYKILKPLHLTFGEFGEILDKNLPKEFWEDEED